METLGGFIILKLQSKVKPNIRIIVLHHLKPCLRLAHKDQFALIVISDVKIFGSD